MTDNITVSKINVFAGQTINYAAELMIAAIPSTCVFNDIELRADIGTTAGDIVAEYHRLHNERAKSWFKSQEGRAFSKELRQRTEQAQNSSNRYMSLLSIIDFSSLESVIEWLVGIARSIDRIDVSCDKQRIVDAFESHGFMSDVNCYDKFDAEDRENVARWIIGQALADLKRNNAPHPVLQQFAEDWKAKFVKGSSQ